MGRWSSWIEGSTRPTPEEMERVQHPIPPELLAAAREATRPSEAEVQRLLRSRRAVRPAQGAERGWARWALGAATLGAVVGVAAVGLVAALGVDTTPGGPSLAAGYGEVSVAIGESVALGGEHLITLGPSIEVRGPASLRVDQAGEAGTAVALLAGRARFDVDPEGAYRKLIVRAGDVEVEVKGTVFDVALVGGEVEVGVTRGRVAVRQGGDEWFVGAGEQWNTRLAVHPIKREVSGEAPSGEAPSGVASTTVGASATLGPALASQGEGTSWGASAEAVVDASSASSSGAAVRAELLSPPVQVDGDPGLVSDPRAPAAAELPRPGEEATAAAARNTMPVYSRLKARYEQGERGQGLSADLTRWLESAEGTDSRRDEVMAMRLVVLAHHRANHETLHSLADFLDRHPGSMWRTDLLVQHARVAHRELGDCGVAIESYRRLEAITAGADQARARVGLGLCLLETGDKKGAIYALEAALAAGVQPVTLRAEAEAACLATRGCVLPK